MARLSADERTAFTDALSRLLAERCAEPDVRRVQEEPRGYDPELWGLMAEMGVIALLVQPEFGGVGGGPVEVERVMELAGAALLSGPLLSSAILSVSLLQALGDDEASARLLPGISDGSVISTVALTGADRPWEIEGVAAKAARDDQGGWMLSGVADYVTDGQNAGVILTVARVEDGIAIFEVEAGAAGLDVAALPTFDHGLRLARLTYSGVSARRLGTDASAWTAVEAMLKIGRIALAGDAAGGAKRVLDMAVDYAKTRTQFGRPIGSFQAIKHMAADLLLEAESAISAARHAASVLDEGNPEADEAIHLAAFVCADAFNTVAATNIQMHGGIGFTWEHPAHLYLRRARAGAALFGAPSWHREQYLQQLEAAHV